MTHHLVHLPSYSGFMEMQEEGQGGHRCSMGRFKG